MALLARNELRSILEREMPNVLDTRWDTLSTDHATGGEHEASAPLMDFDAVVKAENIVEVAHFVRDNFGYSYLSNMTGTDYIKHGIIEMLYQFYNPEGGSDLRVRVRVPRELDQCIVPSLTPTWPGAELQECEAYDMYGVTFDGHPRLRRLYMWDEFRGHPLRKDFPKTGDKYTHVTGE